MTRNKAIAPPHRGGACARAAGNRGNMATADIVIIGAGAAGLMAAIWAGRTAPDRSVVVLDGARTLGAKILVAGVT